VDGENFPADRFEGHRAHLRGVAFRMLGSAAEADDAVQEAWIRLNRADTTGVENMAAWLTTVVARVSLDMLRARASRREEPAPTTPARQGDESLELDPADEAVLASSVGSALLVVLETLAPAERLAFVLHDTFAVPYDQIGAILGRSPSATRQLAHRARLKVQGSDPVADADPSRQRAIVDAFLAASRDGDFDSLVSLLHPDVVLDADATAVRMGSPAAVRGAEGVAAVFSGRALGARPALIDGAVGLVWATNGNTKVAWDFAISDGQVVHIDMIAAPDSLAGLDLVALDG
jgi:RNA polymerase sigma-70 factor (ECF subfamily)